MHRLAVARRAAGLLDEKRQALLAQRARLAREAASARDEWRAAAAEAARWLDRSVLVGDGGQIDLVAAHVEGAAEVDVAWSRTAGVRYPTAAALRAPPPPPAAELAGSTALELAVRAHARALGAAAGCAVAETALARLEAELANTVRSLRALERRWIPEHERALAERELILEEREREDAARARWARRSLGAGPTGVSRPGRAG